MNNTLPLRIIVEAPPIGLGYGLQSGSGNDFDSVQKQVSGLIDLVFNFSVTLKTNKEGQIDFNGPFVQGKKGELFIYIGFGIYAGFTDSVWNGRMKIPLKDITPGNIEKILTDASLVLETHIPGSRDGGPAFATVKPFGGWKVAVP